MIIKMACVPILTIKFGMKRHTALKKDLNFVQVQVPRQKAVSNPNQLAQGNRGEEPIINYAH